MAFSFGALRMKLNKEKKNSPGPIGSGEFFYSWMKNGFDENVRERRCAVSLVFLTASPFRPWGLVSPAGSVATGGQHPKPHQLLRFPSYPIL